MFDAMKPFANAGWLVMMIAAGAAVAGEPLTVMSFNIRYDGHGNRPAPDANAWLHDSGDHRRDRVLRVIHEADPDLLGVQEALQHQVADIAARLPDHAHYTVGRDDGHDGGEHCAIYFRRSRFERLDAGTYWLCDEREQPGAKFPSAACPRIASWVLLREKSGDERQFLFLNTHWDHVSQEAREYSAAAIVEHLAKLGDDTPAIVVGDMNAMEQSPEMRRLLETDGVRLLDSYRQIHPQVQPNEATFNGFANRTAGRRIDYVLHSPAWKTTSAEIVRTTFDGRNASDHFPVVAELVWDE